MHPAVDPGIENIFERLAEAVVLANGLNQVRRRRRADSAQHPVPRLPRGRKESPRLGASRRFCGRPSRDGDDERCALDDGCEPRSRSSSGKARRQYGPLLPREGWAHSARFRVPVRELQSRPLRRSSSTFRFCSHDSPPPTPTATSLAGGRRAPRIGPSTRSSWRFAWH